jgi:ribonuclease P protein component
MTAPNTPDPIKPRKPEKIRNGTAANRIPPRQSLAAVRLRKHSDFQRAYAAARKRQSASMTWFLAPRILIPGPQKARIPGHPGSPKGDCEGARVGLTAGKVLGKAHERNRIKRRMREALRRHLDLLPEGADLILHPRRIVLTMEFSKLEAEIVRILTQARADASKFASAPTVVSPA